MKAWVGPLSSQCQEEENSPDQSATPGRYPKRRSYRACCPATLRGLKLGKEDLGHFLLMKSAP